MNIAKAKALAAAIPLALAVASCARPPGDPAGMSLTADPSAALAVVIAQPQAGRGAVAALVAGSAQTGEHLEIISGTGQVLSSGTAPAPPVMASPAPPPTLPANPTQFQVDTHHRQQQTYAAALTADHRALARTLARQLSSWAAAMTRAIPRVTPGPAAGPGLQPGISSATTFFASLQQAGLGLGARRVIVIFGASGSPSGMPIQAGSLSGITVIITNFQGSLRAQQEWQAALLQAGAARAIVLVPAASDELVSVTRQGLAGQAGPALVDVYFGLDQVTLRPTARATLRHIATELGTIYPGAAVTILGFADPLGSPARNAALSADRALACEAFLVGQGIAASQISAVGYGTDLPAAPSQAAGTQPLDRRAIIIINPAT
jgi:outer membrane protein OmpA-like peptidoglycan-associated protein